MNQSFIDGERYGRDEAAKEHACMVRELADDINKAAADLDSRLDYVRASTLRSASERVRRLAQAIEKGAK